MLYKKEVALYSSFTIWKYERRKVQKQLRDIISREIYKEKPTELSWQYAHLRIFRDHRERERSIDS